jgi:hypothetical protein
LLGFLLLLGLFGGWLLVARRLLILSWGLLSRTIWLFLSWLTWLLEFFSTSLFLFLSFFCSLELGKLLELSLGRSFLVLVRECSKYSFKLNLLQQSWQMLNVI